MHLSPEPLAKKYCFKASVRIVNKAKVPVGVFFAYDTKPTIAKDIETVGHNFCVERESEGYTYDLPQLFLHNECPVELTYEIFFQPFEALKEKLA